MNKCWCIKVAGNVQGVNLRYETCLKAKMLNLRGYVKNRSDDTVEIVACGGIKGLNQLIIWLKSSPGYAKVSRVEYEELRNNQIFEKFKILY